VLLLPVLYRSGPGISPNPALLHFFLCVSPSASHLISLLLQEADQVLEPILVATDIPASADKRQTHEERRIWTWGEIPNLLAPPRESQFKQHVMRFAA
jgi:hypothetical protein